MSDELEEGGHPSPAQPALPAGSTAAALDLFALVRSLPPSGRLSGEDSRILDDWATWYHDTPLPSREYIWDIVANAMGRSTISAEDRTWLYYALDPVLPMQLRKPVQRQRLVAEVREARLEGRVCETVSFDFLLVGGHLSAYRERIQSRLSVHDAVRFSRDSRLHAGAERIRIDLSSGECVGFVPTDDAAPIANEIAASGAPPASVKKILFDGLFPIPVIGTRIRYAASNVDAALPIATFREPREKTALEPAKSRLTALTRALSEKLRPVTNLFR